MASALRVGQRQGGTPPARTLPPAARACPAIGRRGLRAMPCAWDRHDAHGGLANGARGAAAMSARLHTRQVLAAKNTSVPCQRHGPCGHDESSVPAPAGPWEPGKSQAGRRRGLRAAWPRASPCARAAALRRLRTARAACARDAPPGPRCGAACSQPAARACGGTPPRQGIRAPAPCQGSAWPKYPLESAHARGKKATGADRA